MLLTVIFFILSYIVFYFIISFLKFKKLKELELQFIISSLYFYQFKYQIFQILELIYDKADEIDPEYKKDYEKIKISVENRLNAIGDSWILNLQKTLGYNLSYKSWNELIKKAEPLLKQINLDEYRKRDKDNIK